MKTVVIHHAEIGLKKGNFPYFERKLLENIKKIAEKKKVKIGKIRREEKRLLCDFGSSEKNMEDVLKHVFGIKYFAFIEEIAIDITKMENHVEKILKKENPQTIAFSTKRSDKNFKLTSLETNKRFGEISNKLGIKVNYRKPELTIFTEITSKGIYIYTKRIEGYGGLPVETSGKVLCLLSGGMDSIVASWLMMRRGCHVDFLHFHAFNNNEKIKNSKITKIVDLLNKYQIKSNLYVLPYSTYQLDASGKFDEKYDVILFKHYILKVAEAFAKKNNYFAIVTGDNLGQVASQTIENLSVTEQGINIPLFRPLLTFDKQEIINLLKKFNGYNLGIEKYKDCCSIIARKASTKTKLDYFKKILSSVKINNLIEKSLGEVTLLQWKSF